MKYAYVYKDGRAGIVEAEDLVAAKAALPDQAAQVEKLTGLVSAIDLGKFSGSQLVALFNATKSAAIPPVKKFENLSKATARTWEAVTGARSSPEAAAPAPGATEPEVKKTAKPKKPKKAKVAKEKRTGPNDNVAKTLDLIARQTGATLDEIVERLGVTKGSARNIVGDARRVLVAGDKTSTIKVVEVTSSRRAYKVVAA